MKGLIFVTPGDVDAIDGTELLTLGSPGDPKNALLKKKNREDTS